MRRVERPAEEADRTIPAIGTYHEMRELMSCAVPAILWAALTVAANHIFIAGQLFSANRTPGMQLPRRYPDLGAHTKLAAIGILR